MDVQIQFIFKMVFPSRADSVCGLYLVSKFVEKGERFDFLLFGQFPHSSIHVVGVSFLEGRFTLITRFFNKSTMSTSDGFLNSSFELLVPVPTFFILLVCELALFVAE